MSENRFDMLELGEDKPKVAPNSSVFAPVASLQPKEGATAKQDANGNWVNSIGLQSTADHRHVAKVWQDKCIALPTFMDTVKSISVTKNDVLMKESAIRLKDINTLTDGTTISKSGIRSLIGFSEMPTTMFSYMEEFGYEEELTKIMNDALARRTSQWTSKGKDERNFRVRLRTNEADEKYIRAIVSERYGVIDNHEVMEILSNALPYNIDKALASHISHDGDDMFGNILLPDSMKSEPDSDYGVGISFKNSEIRNAAFSIEPFIFRAICLNGMIWGRANSEIKVHQRHMGSIDLKELEEQVQQAITSALSLGNDMLSLLKTSKEVKVANPIKTIIQLSKDSQDNMTIEQCKAWQKGYLESQLEPSGDVHTNSAFGVVNGLTRASQNYSGSVREKMERYASLILAPSIDSDLQAISKRWGQVSDRAESNISNKELERYQFVTA
jgi:hypothetical protein